MKIDQNARYLNSHEWARKDGELVAIGISDHAQDSLSDIVFVEFPAVGDSFEKGEVFGVVESVKAASDLVLPMSGEVVEINETLDDTPEVVNADPYGEGWMIKIKPANLAEWDGLLTATAYGAATE